jgi:outer membrane murein-binding lipoprotein Lpp
MIGYKLGAVAMASCAFLFVVSGCVSQQKYDALQGRYDQLNQTMSAEINSKQMHIERLQNAIKVTVTISFFFLPVIGKCQHRLSKQSPRWRPSLRQCRPPRSLLVVTLTTFPSALVSGARV